MLNAGLQKLCMSPFGILLADCAACHPHEDVLRMQTGRSEVNLIQQEAALISMLQTCLIWIDEDRAYPCVDGTTGAARRLSRRQLPQSELHATGERMPPAVTRLPGRPH